MKKAFFLLSTVLILMGITSCKNFINGSNLMQDIDELVAEVRAPEVEVLISADGNLGTLSPNGKFLYKVNKKYPIMLQLFSDEYTLKNWEAVDRETNKLLPDAVTFDDPSKLETNFTINYQAANLWIRPNYIQNPRIIDFSPKNKAGGVICFSPIELYFNMPVSPEEVKDGFSNIKIEMNGESITGMFNAPVLSSDKKKLIIKPKSEIKQLVQNVSFCDITVSVSDAFKSAEFPDLHINECSYIYRINNAQDTTPPAIKSITVETKPIEEKADKKSIARNADKKSIARNADYVNWKSEDIEYNHINNAVLISCEAIDADSGIDSIIVTETIVNDSDGNPRNQVLPEVVCSTEFEVVDSETYAVDVFEYTLSTEINALVKLNIKVKDRAGFYSIDNDYNYYVIAEPVFINDAILKFEIPNPDHEFGGTNALRFLNDDGLDVQKLLKIKDIKHSYYKDNYSKINIDITYWNGKEKPKNDEDGIFKIYSTFSEEDDANIAYEAKDDDYSLIGNSFTRDPYEITTVEMTLTDDIGHSYVQQYKIPCSPRFVIVDTEYDDGVQIVYNDVSDRYYDETLYYCLFSKIDDEDWDTMTPLSNYTTYWQFYNGQLSDWFDYNGVNSCELYLGLSTSCYDVDKKNHTYGCSDKIVHLHCVMDDDSFITYERIYDTEPDVESVNFPKTVFVEKVSLSEDGLINFILSYPQDFIPTAGITYIPYYKSLWYEDGETIYVSSSFYIKPHIMNMYYLGLAAYDSKAGKIIDSKDFGHLVDNNDPDWESYIDDSFVIIDATDNIAAPKFEAEKSRAGFEQLKPNTCILGVMNTGSYGVFDNQHYITFESLGSHAERKSDLVYGENKNGHKTVKLDYSFIENNITNYSTIKPYSSSLNVDFNNIMYVEIPVYKDYSNSKNMEKFIAEIPCNSAANSYYTMYGKIYDTNEQSTVKTLGVASTYVYSSLPSVIKEGSNIRIKVDKSKAESESVIKMKLYSVTDGDCWIDSVNTIANSNIGFENTAITSIDNLKNTNLNYKTQSTASSFDFITTNNCTENFFISRYMRFYIYTEPTSGENKEFKHKFYKTVYIYPEYYKGAITCNKKNFFTGANGIQFYIDQPTLVQTLYCKGDLGNDADLWATKAMEADVTVLDPSGDCIYRPVTDDEHLPSGNYYCIVAHFADGTSCMSEVKYK